MTKNEVGDSLREKAMASALTYKWRGGGDSLELLCLPEKKRKLLRAQPSAKPFNPQFIDFGFGRMFFLI